jgi:ABC-type glycerol-3-phosphate transport system substrate-binding protein
VRFSLGKPVLALLLAAAASGVAVNRRPAAQRADLIIWSCAESHVRTLSVPVYEPDGRLAPSLLDRFRLETGFSAAISLMGQMGENIRLASAFMSGESGPSAPDLCEIEIHSIGQFLRPPVDDIGLLPLNDFLERSGWDRRIIASRLAPWSKTDPRTGRRIVYGIPQDVHPVTITYRRDLFDQAGIDPRQAGTWEQFHQLCLGFQDYWAAHGRPDARAIALSTDAPDEIVEMLLQRHVNLIDQSNRLHFTDPKVLDTVVFYARLVAGRRAIGGDVPPGVQWTQDFARGNVCAVCTPDWKADYLRQFAPDLAGNVAMMPLPRFDPDDAPTSTSGGTMVGICRACPHPQRAWELLEFSYLGSQANRARLAAGDNVLPAIPEYWSDPAYHQPDPFFAGTQNVGDLYVTLAGQIPERLVTPYTYQAELALAAVMYRAERYVAAEAADQSVNGLKQACARWLAEAQADVQRRIDFGNFEP